MPARFLAPTLAFYAALALLIVPAVAEERSVAGGKEKELPILNEGYWSLVAQSHGVLAGQLDVPVAKIRQAREANEHEYVSVKVAVSKVYKGSFLGGEMAIDYFTQPASYKPSPADLTALHGKRAFLFLVRGGPKNKWYLVQTPEALQTFTEERARVIQAEADGQRRILEAPWSFLKVKRNEIFDEVKGLIEYTQDADKAENAYHRMLRLGRDGLGAMVFLMDDRRDLAVKSISLPNPRGHWEGLRHYGPKKVVDLLDAILNHIWGFGGSIVNGGDEFQRARAVEEWQIFLYKRQCDKATKEKTE